MDKKLILASKSPRRQEILSQLGFKFDICPSDKEETPDFSEGIGRAAENLAAVKALDVLKKHPDSIVIGSDTFVVLDGKPLFKPANENDAINMLKSLSGQIHKVYTGVAVVDYEEQNVFHTVTQVEFFELTDDEIKQYVASGEPMDKAGAYGIQGKGCVLVKRINGDYFSVMGLPAALSYRAIKNMIDKYQKNK